MTGLSLLALVMIVGALVASLTRLALRRRAATAAERGPTWRLVALAGLQVTAGALLWLTLFPPQVLTAPGRLVVLTQGATARLPASGDVVVALPEAARAAGAIRVPDLATALRLYPEPGRLRIEGHGLSPRDRIPLDRPASFAPPAPPKGIIALALPAPVAPGARFTVGGEIGALKAGVVELLDPAGAVVDKAEVKTGARFSLSGATRAAGPVLFDLRLRDAAGRQVEHVEIPVEARAPVSPRVLVLAGAPSAETKYLRRWAQDAGIALNLEVSLGGGVQLGDAPVALTRATLDAVDLLVIDDRRWETLDRQDRAAIDGAVRGGLGLVLRPSGPLSDAVRRDWAGLGLPTAETDGLHAVRLNGPNSDVNRHDILPTTSRGVPLAVTKDGQPLAAWRARGQGRVALWTLADSYALVLTGRADRHGELWSELFSAVARPGEAAGVHVEGLARAGQRVALCGAKAALSVIEPNGATRRPLVDPRAAPGACAGYWPASPGWRTIVEGDRRSALFVQPADAAPSLAQADARAATLALVETAASGPAREARRAPGSPWPWAAALLAVLGALWWLERRSPRR
ncbi:hypothetical protein J2X45_001441 [Caulobacter sp. BE264]|uniref:hypothetical protein n=1 Tax=Caulobacter sp. BE264 TaxID=2817724 RepID=UPI00285B7CDC|nr:hypothetical protein [Caulobacter sp. BE264]MDR7230360.1 hypothetical protein [Caulobacter sp. BE264]